MEPAGVVFRARARRTECAATERATSERRPVLIARLFQRREIGALSLLTKATREHRSKGGKRGAKKKAGDRPSVRLPTCGCVLGSLPKRSGFKALQRGKFCGGKVLVNQNGEV